MNRKEKALLRDLVRAVIRENQNAWWELKHQILQGGYQSFYSAQGDFDSAVEFAVQRLPDDVKFSLIKEWRNAMPIRTEVSDIEILTAYPRLVLEEIVERARIAAYRTVNW